MTSNNFVGSIEYATQDVPLRSIHEFPIKSTLDLSKRNVVKFSNQNRYLLVNMHKCLNIYEFPVNFSIDHPVVDKDSLYKSKTIPSSISLWPLRKSTYQSHSDPDIPHLKCTELLFESFDLVENDSLLSEIIVLATLTNETRLDIHLKKFAHDWQLVDDLQPFLGNDVRTSFSCLCFLPNFLLENGVFHCYLITGMKNGSLFLWKLSINLVDNEEESFRARVVQVVESSKQFEDGVSTIQNKHNLLVVESSTGTVILYSLADPFISDTCIEQACILWTSKNFNRSNTFAISKISLNSFEILMFKRGMLIAFRISLEETCKLQETTVYNLELLGESEIFAFCHESSSLEEMVDNKRATTYIVSTINPGQLFQLVIDLHSRTAKLHKMVCSQNLLDDPNRYVHSSSVSTNSAFTALITTEIFFSENSHDLDRLTNGFVHFVSFVDAKLNAEKLWVELKNLLDEKHAFISLIDRISLFQHDLLPQDEGFYFLLTQLLNEFDQLNVNAQQNMIREEQSLYFLKVLHCLVKRFQELSLIPRSLFYNEKERQLLKAMLATVRKSILNKHFRMVLHQFDDLKGDQWQLTDLQLLSLYNLTQSGSLCNIIPARKIKKIVHECENKTVPLFEEGSDSVKSCTLPAKYNKCFFCPDDKKLTISANFDSCSKHRVDLCSNSMLVICPLEDEFDKCIRCQKSFVLSQSVWPDLVLKGFTTNSLCCLYCI